MSKQARAPSTGYALVHFLKWALPLLLLYVVGGVLAGVLIYGGFERASAAFPDPVYGAGDSYNTGEGALTGLLFGGSSAAPLFLGVWLINSFIAVLFRRSIGAGWLTWVYWAFGLAAGLMPVFAFLTSGLTFSASGLDPELAQLSAELQARAVALDEAAQTATIVLTLVFFALALLTSWWNWRAGKAWQKKVAS